MIWALIAFLLSLRLIIIDFLKTFVTIMGVALSLLKRLFTGSPDSYNPTNANIENYHEMERRIEESTKREAEARKREEEALQREKEARDREACFVYMQRREEETNGRMLETEKREAETRKALDDAQKDLQRIKFYLEKGIQPEVWPTEEEFQMAKNKIKYDPEKLHFAVCGSSGSGKSSLVNAFRGLKNSDPQAAPTGVVETTKALTRYPDPREELPYNRLVWFDCPGAGTLEIPGWQYFNQQGLFIFDVIVLVYDSVIISISFIYLRLTDCIISF